MATRRDFLKAGVLAGAGAVLTRGATQKAVAAPAGSPNVTKFVDPLIAAIPLAEKAPIQPYPGADYYEITMSAGSHKFHSRYLGPAATFRYGAMPYLGPTIEAQKGKPVVVKFINNLPPTEAQHPLVASIDPTVPDPFMAYFGYDAEGKPLPPPGGRAVPHLHGGFTPPQFDGHPHSWFTPDGKHGSHYGTLPGAAANEAILVYPNNQPASNIWYHDHAMGITRLNVYAGLAGLYFVRDEYDTGKPFGTPGLPATALNLPAAPYEVPLVIQDKQFNANGTLFYPTVGITAVHPIWMPEFFGDTPVVNAVAYPYLDVEPRRYRFRIVNGSQARFYNFWFDDPATGPVPFWVIGMEQSLLPAPVSFPKGKFLLSPGERVDVIVDFAAFKGKTLTMKNNGKAPYPGGKAGGVPQIMQFRVGTTVTGGTDTSANPATLALPVVPRLTPTPGAPMREIVMKEEVDPLTGLPIDMKLNGKWFGGVFDDVNHVFTDTTIDEAPIAGTTEIWQYINLTVDAHPMHMHLVKFQVYNRQPFNAAGYTTAWLAWKAGTGPKPVLANFFTGPAVPPPPEEMGWKDTAKAYPGEILRVIATFDVQDTDILGIAGTKTELPAEYVYHCHILEHEENEMMRPFQVRPVPSASMAESRQNGQLGMPEKYALEQNYPNPFNPSTEIRFALPETGYVELIVFNALGQEVRRLMSGEMPAGSHAVRFDAGGLASGTYYYRLKAGNFVQTKKMVLAK